MPRPAPLDRALSGLPDAILAHRRRGPRPALAGTITGRVLSFSVLAACFEELEHTSSRKQLTTLLAELLGKVADDEIDEVAYLLQGRVAPLYEPVEFGLGERSIEKAVAQAFGVPQAEVHLTDAAAGDVGLVVAELAAAAGASGTRTDRPVRDVFADLR